MANKGQAIKPVFNIPAFLEQKEELNILELTDEEKVLGTGANTAFWTALKSHVNNQLLELDKMGEAAISTGAPLEEIGRNAVVISQIKGVINKIFHVVDDAKEALETQALETNE